MRILAVDSTAAPASVAIVDNNKILSEAYTNTGLTHSQTIMPMIDCALKNANIEFNSIDAFAVNVGPGSFTGVRIGISALKGLAMPQNKPCVSVSTLHSIAYNFVGRECIVCAVMDARCAQVYAGLFKCSQEGVERISEDMAIKIIDLNSHLNYDCPIVLAGDGAELCYQQLHPNIPNLFLAPPHLRFQRASSVAFLGLQEIENSHTTTAEELKPIYLRMPQAERELKMKETLK